MTIEKGHFQIVRAKELFGYLATGKNLTQQQREEVFQLWFWEEEERKKHILDTDCEIGSEYCK